MLSLYSKTVFAGPGQHRDTQDPCRGFITSVDYVHRAACQQLDAHDPCRGLIGDSDGHAASPQKGSPASEDARGEAARIHSGSAWTRTIPVEGSSASKTRKCARSHSISDATHTIPAEGSSVAPTICTAPQRQRVDAHDPCGRFISWQDDLRRTTEPAPRTRAIPEDGSSGTLKICATPQRQRRDTQHP